VKRLDRVYLVFGEPLIHPEVFKQVKHAYSYVLKNKPKSKVLKFNLKELEKEFRGNEECLKIMFNHRINGKIKYLVIYKCFTYQPDQSELHDDSKYRNEKYVKGIWKGKFSEKNDFERILNMERKLEKRIEQNISTKISEKLNEQSEKEELKMSPKEAYSRARNIILDKYEDHPPSIKKKKKYKRMETSLEILSTALKLRSKLDREKNRKHKIIKKKVKIK